MDDNKIGSELDDELRKIKLSEDLKKRIRMNAFTKRRRRNPLKVAAAVAALVVCFATVGYAGYYINSRINVNENTLPELDPMHIVKTNHVEGASDGDGEIIQSYETYDKLTELLGIHLLDSPLAVNNPYMQVKVDTDNKDYNFITVENYIIGDTSNFKFLPDEKVYIFDSGREYYSPVSLSIDLILSEMQKEIGIEQDYLGNYKFVESFQSKQGYKVNIIRSTSGDGVSNIESKKLAIFVADGMRYTLSANVSLNKLKDIVNSMR